MWKISVDMTVRAKKYSTAIKAFKKKYPSLVCYMDALEESLESMKFFYPNGLSCRDENSSIIYNPDTEEYSEWNKGIYSVSIEYVDENRVYLCVNSNEIE